MWDAWCHSLQCKWGLRVLGGVISGHINTVIIENLCAPCLSIDTICHLQVMLKLKSTIAKLCREVGLSYDIFHADLKIKVHLNQQKKNIIWLVPRFDNCIHFFYAEYVFWKYRKCLLFLPASCALNWNLNVINSLSSLLWTTKWFTPNNNNKKK